MGRCHGALLWLIAAYFTVIRGVKTMIMAGGGRDSTSGRWEVLVSQLAVTVLRIAIVERRIGGTPSVFREQGIHIVADTVAEVVADDAYSIEPCHQGIAIAGRQLGDGLQSLLEHADHCMEITFIMIPNIVAESCGPFAVEDHHLREPRRFANSFSVAGDGVFG